MNESLREHLEWWRDNHVPATSPPFTGDYCAACDGRYLHPCEDHRRAIAALAILDKCCTEKRVNRDDVEYDVLIVPKEPHLAT